MSLWRMARPSSDGQVEGQAPLAPVGVLEEDVDVVGYDVEAGRGQAPHGVAPLDVLDLDDLGAPVRQQGRGGRHEGVLGDLEDPDTLHDLAHRWTPRPFGVVPAAACRPADGAGVVVGARRMVVPSRSDAVGRAVGGGHD